MTVTIGVVILDFDQSRITARCLRSLVKGSRIPEIVVLVENGAESFADEQRIDLSNLNIITLRAGQNLGCAGGRNLGLNYLIMNSSVTTLVTLDNDTIVPNDFFERVAGLTFSPLEVVAPIILDLRTNNIWSCGGTLAPNGLVEQLTEISDEDHQNRLIVDWAPGACLIMSRQIWNLVGNFDNGFTFYFEDIEWCLRLRAIGGHVLVRTDLLLLHEPHQSLGGFGSQTRGRLWVRNSAFFRFTSIQVDPLENLKWLGSEVILIARDLMTGYASWSVSRFGGLVEGLRESIRRKAKRNRYASL